MKFSDIFPWEEFIVRLTENHEEFLFFYKGKRISINNTSESGLDVCYGFLFNGQFKKQDIKNYLTYEDFLNDALFEGKNLFEIWDELNVHVARTFNKREYKTFKKKSDIDKFVSKHKKIQAELNIMKAFVLGEIDTPLFMEQYSQNINLQKVIIFDKKRTIMKTPDDGFVPENWIEKYVANDIRESSEIFRVVCNYFRCRKVDDSRFFNKDSALLSLLLSAEPEWLDADTAYLLKIYDSLPDNLSREEKRETIEKTLLENFKYNETPPQWIRNPEWPIIDGKPLVFSYQKEILSESEVYYYFYNDETQQQYIIKQNF